jgi:hypothetical protein
MKQTENTLQDLKCMLIEDGYTEANIVLRTLTKAQEQVKNCSMPDVSEMFKFAGYLYGNFDYYDNTEDGDIYIHNDNGLKYTREKVYQQWIGIRNSR